MTNDIKFSILIPTKNRAELLKDAINSILNQTYTNFEIVISDNCSEDNTEEYVKSLCEPRIKYIRQTVPLSVSENWNAANSAAEGDYIIMLGDDDAILPYTLEKLNKYILGYDFPEVINFPAYLYQYPSVRKEQQKALLYDAAVMFGFYKKEPYILSEETRRTFVNASLEFYPHFGYNMQYYCYKREMIKKLEKYGKFYESPYPDYYTANVFMILADRVLVLPERLVIIGITPKSYGYYYQNNKEKEGMKFHNDADYRKNAPESVKRYLLDIAEMQTAAMATFALIAERFPKYKLSFSSYYNAVINRIFEDYPKFQAVLILIKAFWFKVEFWGYLRCLRKIRRRAKNFTPEFFENKRKFDEKCSVPYQNINEVITAITENRLCAGE